MWILQRICPVLITTQAEQVLQVSSLNSFLYSVLQASSLNLKGFYHCQFKTDEGHG